MKKKAFTKKPPPHLRSQDIERIVGILEGWRETLTWDLLVEKLTQRGMPSYTRQALDRHPQIKSAFAAAKSRLRQSPPAVKRDLPVELEKAVERNHRLDAENQRLRLENNRFIEQFIRWRYNAHLKGCTEDYLNRPLPSTYREPSRV
jgi:hypothetical protein